MIVGVLGLQGAVREHVRSLEKLTIATRIVKRVEDLDGLDGLVLPGGESSTMTLLGEDGMLRRLRGLAEDGLPMFGTCAGMILLAREAKGRQRPGLDAIDITVARNASGRQVDSFETTLDVEGVGPDVPAVFIRAPYVTRVGPGVTPMARHDGVVVMACQGRILVTSFHPELTDDLRIHRYFIEELVEKEEDG